MSLQELQDKLGAALREKFGLDGQGYAAYYLVDAFDSYLIARGPDGLLYQVPYSVDGTDGITLGDLQEVETAYVPVSSSARFLAAEAPTGSGDNDGWAWPVEVMRAGFASGTVTTAGQRIPLPQFFTPEVVSEVAANLNGVRFGRRHPVSEMEEQDPARIAGWFSDPVFTGEAARANLHLLNTEGDIRARLMAARDAGKLDLFGVSVLGYFGFQTGKKDGKDALVSTRLGKLVSVDMCGEPGAGGRFLRTAASVAALAEISQLQSSAIKRKTTTHNNNGGTAPGAGRNHGGAMKDRILKVLEALRKLNAGSASNLETEFATVKEEGYGDFLLRVTEAATTAAADATTSNATELTALVTAAQTALQETKLLQTKNLIERKLGESKLPQPAQELVRTHLAARVVTEAEIDTEINGVRTAFAAYSPVGRVVAGGMVAGLDSTEKVQLAMDLMMGVKEAQGKGVVGFRGLREAYALCTGDSDIRITGQGFYRVAETIGTSDFPNILLNSMTKKGLQDYAELALDGLDMIYTTSPVNDYKNQDRVRLGYLNDLPTVSEAGPYTELTKPTDEKISYAVGKVGGVLTITEETIRNDDLNKISSFPTRMARAGRRTVKQFITNFFINNPNFDPDTVAWFHASHNNLATAALSSAALDAAKIALRKQTEKDSGKPLGLSLSWLMVPADLEPTALQINRNNTGTNNWYQMFGVNNERIIVNELLSDANDWYVGTTTAECPCLEIGFLDNIQTPQIFLANQPTVGTQFTNDQIQYKVKMVFGGDVIDFRGAYKSVVA